MKREYCRYTEAQLKSLGYTPRFDEDVLKPNRDNKSTLRDIALGQMKNIIEVLFSSKDGRLDNDLSSVVSENAPESVRSFVNNVLLCPIQTLQSAPDDETAFRCLIPRDAYTPEEVKPYLNNIREFISESRTKFNQSQNKTD